MYTPYVSRVKRSALRTRELNWPGHQWRAIAVQHQPQPSTDETTRQLLHAEVSALRLNIDGLYGDCGDDSRSPSVSVNRAGALAASLPASRTGWPTAGYVRPYFWRRKSIMYYFKKTQTFDVSLSSFLYFFTWGFHFRFS